MPVRYLIYISRLADTVGHAVIPSLIRQARVNNAVRGVTGALMFDGERFCQYLEGDPDEVVRTFTAIESDPRHVGLRILASGNAAAPRFAQWSMAYVYAINRELIDAIDNRTVPAVAEAFEAALSRCDVA